MNSQLYNIYAIMFRTSRIHRVADNRIWYLAYDCSWVYSAHNGAIFPHDTRKFGDPQ